MDCGSPGGRKSTRSGPLSRARVLDAALRIADRDGIGAVTMRRVGAELGVEAMSLYHHLPGKDGLVDGLVETVIGEIQAEVAARPDAEIDGWRADLRSRALAARRVMLRHPWAPALVSSRHAIPAAAYPYFEDVLTVMLDGGFTYHLAHSALHSLGSMVLGFAQEVFDFGSAADEAAHLVAMTAAELHDAADPMLGFCDAQTEFEFTLDLLLDGLDRARVAGRAS